MRIQVKEDGRNINISIPTCLIFNKGTAWIARRFGRHYAGDAMKGIPPEAIDALFAEIRRIKKKYGSWELVEAESSDGELVKVTL